MRRVALYALPICDMITLHYAREGENAMAEAGSGRSGHSRSNGLTDAPHQVVHSTL